MTEARRGPRRMFQSVIVFWCQRGLINAAIPLCATNGSDTRWRCASDCWRRGHGGRVPQEMSAKW